MNKLQKSLGIGALALALAGCQDKAVTQKATESTPDKPKLEEKVRNEFGDIVGSYRDAARYNLMDATKYWNVKYWNAPESQVLDESTQKEVLRAVIDRAEFLVNRGYPAEVVRDYFTFTREIATKNSLKLPDKKLSRLLTTAVHRNISYELATAKSCIVDDDFPNSAENHLGTAVRVAQQFGVDIQRSQHGKLYNEVRGLLQSKYNITVQPNK